MKAILREVGMIARCFESIANIEFKDYELGKNQYIYMVRIAENPGIIMEKLCDMIKVDKSTASRAIKKLVDNGLVEKRDHGLTGKKVELYPTSKGKLINTMLQEDEEYSNVIALDGLSSNEMDTLLTLLTKVRKNIEVDWELVKKGGVRPYKRIPFDHEGNLVDDRIVIEPFEMDDLAGYREVSYEWLNKYDIVEPIDEDVLNDPKGMILDKGGYIWVAKEKEKIVGTISLVKHDEKTYEISKLGVRESTRGKGIASKLLFVALMKANNLFADRVILYTISYLKEAHGLYKKFGFLEVESDDFKYDVADIKMVLELN